MAALATVPLSCQSSRLAFDRWHLLAKIVLSRLLFLGSGPPETLGDRRVQGGVASDTRSEEDKQRINDESFASFHISNVSKIEAAEKNWCIGKLSRISLLSVTGHRRYRTVAGPDDDVEVSVALPNGDISTLEDDVTRFESEFQSSSEDDRTGSKVVVTLSKADVAVLLDKAELSGCDVAAAADFLAELGCREDQMKSLLKSHPAIFARGKDPIQAKAAVFRSFGINTNCFLQAIKIRPHFLFFRDEKIITVLSFVRDNLNVQDLGKMVCVNPSFLGLPTSTIQSKVRLWADLGVPLTPKVLEMYSDIFSRSDITIRVGIQTVRSILPNGQGTAVLSKYPPLAGRKKTNMESTVQQLEEIFGQETTSEMLLKCPLMLPVPPVTLTNTFTKLREYFGDDTCQDMIRLLPGILPHNWDRSINPKLNFLVEEMGRSKDDVAFYPIALKFSLNKRLKPRYYTLVQAGIDTKTHSLRGIYSQPDKKFEKKFNVSLPHSN